MEATKQTTETKVTVEAFAIEMCVRERGNFAESIVHHLKEASKKLNKNSMIEAIALVASFKDDKMAENMASRIERRSPYIKGPLETEIISDLGTTLSLYKDSPKAVAEILNAWSEAAYCKDWGDPEGALLLTKMMKEKEVVFLINWTNDDVAGDVAGCVANIARFLKDQKCVVAAARSVASEGNSTVALSRARQLEQDAERLGKQAMMGMGWEPADEQNKNEFLEIVAKRKTEIGNLAR
jgi:hypothetical protein